MKQKIFLLMGPSGSGKTTLGGYLKELGIPELVSHTSRPPRKGEVNGVNYYFVDKEKFMDLELIEFVEYDGHYYGMSKDEVRRKFAQSNKVFVIAEFNGAKQFKEAYPQEIVIIFITIPLAEMEKRMRERGDSEKSIKRRIERAIQQKEHDNKWIADYVIENINLEKSKEQLKKIVESEINVMS